MAPGLLLFGILAGCGTEPGDGDLCTAKTTPITEIQGSGYDSPLEGTQQVVTGVVTAIAPGHGFYLESADERGDGASSGLFISDALLSRQVLPGQGWVLIGQVEETGSGRDKMTTLSGLSSFASCEDGRPLPLTPARLPLDNPTRESLEGMRVSFEQPLFVTDVYAQRHGGLTLSAGTPLRTPTETVEPGKAAADQARQNRNRSLKVSFQDKVFDPLAAGSAVHDLAGVLGHDGRSQVLLAQESRTDAIPVPARVTPSAPGSLRVVNANLLNFFNGDGRGGGFPAERGAETREEFREQQARTRAALAVMNPDLLAVQELENDGFDGASAAASLLELLDDGRDGEFEVIRRSENRLGRDVITVGLFYRRDVLEPVGASHTLDSLPFQDLSRQPLAQLFREKHSGETFLVAVNHLKSKGSCPEARDDVNANHGQGCWNIARTAAVDALLPWLEGLAGDSGTRHILILGDMNAYRMEDPVRRFLDAGYPELVERLAGLPQYSHRYFGQAGTLDYAFASPSLADLATYAEIWHINADWPQGMTLPEPWLRMSDHDPVIVDFDFGQ
jgi:predicted extracellular nuclease